MDKEQIKTASESVAGTMKFGDKFNGKSILDAQGINTSKSLHGTITANSIKDDDANKFGGLNRNSSQFSKGIFSKNTIEENGTDNDTDDIRYKIYNKLTKEDLIKLLIAEEDKNASLYIPYYPNIYPPYQPYPTYPAYGPYCQQITTTWNSNTSYSTNLAKGTTSFIGKKNIGNEQSNVR